MNELHAQSTKERITENSGKVNKSFKKFSLNYKNPSPNNAHIANGDPLRTPADRASTVRPVVDYSQKILRNLMENRASHRERHGEEESRLSLELEIDESINSLLRQVSFDKLNKNCNKSVDVTLTQQSSMPYDHATVSVEMDDVWQLIDQPGSVAGKESKFPRDSRSHDKEQLEFLTDYELEEGSDNLYVRGVKPPKCQQVYTSPHQTFNHIRQKLPCMAHSPMHADDFDKPGTPCLCQHCGMVGVLVESQKRPAIPHTPNPKFSGQPRNPHNTSQKDQNVKVNRRLVDLRSKSKSETNLILLKELTSKVTSLEERLNEHEEKTVKKDYFKFVIHKLLTQYSNKINELRTATVYPNKTNITTATQYSKKPIRKVEDEGPERDHERLYVTKTSNHRVKGKSSTEDLSYERHHKRQVIKNKIARQGNGNKLHMPINYQVKTVMNGSSAIEQTKQHIPTKATEDISAHAIRNLCNIVYNRYRDSKSIVPSDPSPREREKVIPEKLLQSIGADTHQSLPSNSDAKPNSTPPAGLAGPAGRAQNGKNRSNSSSAAACAKRMNVSYVSTALETWQDDSEQEFAAAKNTREHEQKREQHSPHYQPQEAHNNSGHISNKSDAKNKTKHSIEEKIKYLKYLAKRKNVDESILWANILSQAQKHIRSKEDTVSIQLPSLVSGPDMSELELTLSKLHEIARRSRVKSSMEVKYQSSSERLTSHEPVQEKRNKPRKGIRGDDNFHNFIAL